MRHFNVKYESITKFIFLSFYSTGGHEFVRARSSPFNQSPLSNWKPQGHEAYGTANQKPAHPQQSQSVDESIYETIVHEGKFM